MNWPSHTDYQDAIQSPQLCFQEEELKSAALTNDMLGMPRVMSGNFASVYELTTQAGRHYAVRCFVRQVANQQVRYNMLTRHLQTVSLPFLVGFDFQLRGLRLKGEWYPIVKMDWVTGMPMHIYVEDHVNEPETLRRLAAQWRELVKGLRENQIAHGDLQHGNVMCTPAGEFRLVDYDGMYVPAFGQGRSPELGHANYQHPRRTPDYYDINLDNFAALVVYTSLLALAREPDLWQKFHTGDNLIFLANDFKDPRNAKVFQRLKQSPEPEVQKLAAVLERACIWPIAQVPLFEAALAGGPLPEPAPTTAAASALPDWLQGTEPLPARPASRPAPAAPVRMSAADYSASVPEAVTQPLRTSTAVTPSPARVPVKSGDENPPLNYFALAAVAVGILAIIPSMHWFGLLAVICGVIGWRQLQTYQTPLKWVALAGIVLGGAVFAIGLIKFIERKPPPPASPRTEWRQPLRT